VNEFDAGSLKALFNAEGVSVERIFFYKHSLMQACCGVIHRFMKFDRYTRPLPALICNFFNLSLFHVLNSAVRFQERLTEKRDSGKHIFLVLRKKKL